MTSRMPEDLLRNLAQQTPSKIVFVVADGLGGLPHPTTRKTELETAITPNLDRIAREGISGLTYPVLPGITPGSGPGHLAIFGYDPLYYDIGRGVLEAVGLDMDMDPGSVAARGNFCSIDEQGIITDRRAGRIPTDQSSSLVSELNTLSAGEGIEINVAPGREHRFAIVLKGKGLSDAITDTDPQREGLEPGKAQAMSSDGALTAQIVNKFVQQSRDRLSNSHPANMILLRGFSAYPELPSLQTLYKLRAAAIAPYPMYRGLAKIAGMAILPVHGDTFSDEIQTLRAHYDNHDFFYIHVKATDSAGEDGDFQRKVEAIETIDNAMPDLLSLNPDVLIITGDHSTPATLAGHSWHPVPTLLKSAWTRRSGAQQFSETACLIGGLGQFSATQLMSLAMAHALKLAKYGA